MRRYGQPLVAHFGEGNPKTEGFSAVQLIETSSVVAHFSEYNRSVYLDVFSCRAYDPAFVERFSSGFFSPSSCTASVRTRF